MDKNNIQEVKLLEQATDLIGSSKKIFVLTGAGISTDLEYLIFEDQKVYGHSIRVQKKHQILDIGFQIQTYEKLGGKVC